MWNKILISRRWLVLVLCDFLSEKTHENEAVTTKKTVNILGYSNRVKNVYANIMENLWALT